MQFEFLLTGTEHFIEASRQLQRRMVNTIGNAMRRGVRRTATTVKKDIRTSSGLGKSIWGAKGKGLTPIVTVIRPRPSGDSGIETGLKLKGLAAMIEDGGQIGRHPIEPHHAAVRRKLGKRSASAADVRRVIGKLHDDGTLSGALAFQVGGHTVFAQHVNHPGAPVSRHGFGAAALNRDGDAIRGEVDTDVGKLVHEVFGGQ